MVLECAAYVGVGASPLQRCTLRQDHARRGGAADRQPVIEWLYEGDQAGAWRVPVSGLEPPTYTLRIQELGITATRMQRSGPARAGITRDLTNHYRFVLAQRLYQKCTKIGALNVTLLVCRNIIAT